LTVKCGGNVHDLGVVEITASGPGSGSPRYIADFCDYLRLLLEGDKLSQWVCLNFKTLRIEPSHYTIASSSLKS
jgi:hypothetical protein